MGSAVRGRARLVLGSGAVGLIAATLAVGVGGVAQADGNRPALPTPSATATVTAEAAQAAEAAEATPSPTTSTASPTTVNASPTVAASVAPVTPSHVTTSESSPAPVASPSPAITHSSASTTAIAAQLAQAAPVAQSPAAPTAPAAPAAPTTSSAMTTRSSNAAAEAAAQAARKAAAQAAYKAAHPGVAPAVRADDPTPSPTASPSPKPVRQVPRLTISQSLSRVVDNNGNGKLDSWFRTTSLVTGLERIIPADQFGYSFTVTNSGEQSISGIRVVDARLERLNVPVVCQSTSLAVGASMRCDSGLLMVSSTIAASGIGTNYAYATGTAVDGKAVKSNASSSTYGLSASTDSQPAMDVLPKTGSISLSWPAGAGFGLIAMGGALLVTRRRLAPVAEPA